MKKIALLLATLLVVCLMATACGGDVDPVDSTPESSVETPDSSVQPESSTPNQTPTSSVQPESSTPPSNDPPAQGTVTANALVSTDVAAGTYMDGTPLAAGSIFVAGPGTKGVIVDTSSAVSFGSYTGVTNRMKLGGAMDNTFKNSIKFTTEGACTLTVYAKSSSSSDLTRCGYVLNASGQQVGEVSAPFSGSGAPTMATFAIPAAGTYYFGGNVNGINVYFIGIS